MNNLRIFLHAIQIVEISTFSKSTFTAITCVWAISFDYFILFQSAYINIPSYISFPNQDVCWLYPRSTFMSSFSRLLVNIHISVLFKSFWHIVLVSHISVVYVRIALYILGFRSISWCSDSVLFSLVHTLFYFVFEIFISNFFFRYYHRIIGNCRGIGWVSFCTYHFYLLYNFVHNYIKTN